MFSKHRGDSILEWVILASLVIAVVGGVVYTIISNGSTQGTNVGKWVTSINVPAAHP